MGKQTQQDKIIKWFLSIGFTEMESRSGKYRQFKKAINWPTHDYSYFVGRKGAIRAGKNISSSFSITNRIKQLMEKTMEKENV